MLFYFSLCLNEELQNQEYIAASSQDARQIPVNSVPQMANDECDRSSMIQSKNAKQIKIFERPVA